MRRIFGSEFAMVRASVFAYKRLKICSEHSYGYSIRYGSAITAYHEGFETICTVRLWCSSVSDFPDFPSLANSNFFEPGPRIGNGSDSVIKMRRDNTGRKPSSPSDTRPVEARTL